MGGTRVSALVSFGSNIDPRRNLQAGFELLGDLCDVEATSRVFVTRAVGPRAMPDFHNAAAEIATRLSPAQLKFGVLREIEGRLGRNRIEDRNAPRSIDLDLSLFGDEVVENEPLGLWIPDPEILTRIHIALPLAEIAPKRRHPLSGETLSTIAQRLSAAAAPGEIRPAQEGSTASGASS